MFWSHSSCTGALTAPCRLDLPVTTTSRAISRPSLHPSSCPVSAGRRTILACLTCCCLHLLCLGAGLPIRLVLLGQCPHSSLSTTTVPHPLTLSCSGQAAGYSWLLRAGGNCSVFSPQSHHGTRDLEGQRAARHQQ